MGHGGGLFPREVRPRPPGERGGGGPGGQDKEMRARAPPSSDAFFEQLFSSAWVVNLTQPPPFSSSPPSPSPLCVPQGLPPPQLPRRGAPAALCRAADAPHGPNHPAQAQELQPGHLSDGAHRGRPWAGEVGERGKHGEAGRLWDGAGRACVLRLCIQRAPYSPSSLLLLVPHLCRATGQSTFSVQHPASLALDPAAAAGPSSDAGPPRKRPLHSDPAARRAAAAAAAAACRRAPSSSLLPLAVKTPASLASQLPRKPPPRDTASVYRGVAWSRPQEQWECTIDLDDAGLSRKVSLGFFEDEEEAARAYDRAFLLVRGR
jgi:hypothetical protein